jgi:hypothetical protein
LLLSMPCLWSWIRLKSQEMELHLFLQVGPLGGIVAFPSCVTTFAIFYHLTIVSNKSWISTNSRFIKNSSHFILINNTILTCSQFCFMAILDCISHDFDCWFWIVMWIYTTQDMKFTIQWINPC